MATKLVNGVRVEVPAGQLTALEAEWLAVEPITPAQIDAERDRRLRAGQIITVTGYGDVAIQGRQQDMVTYANLAMRAAQRVQAGDTTPMQFRDRDDVIHSLTPAEMVELMNKAGEAATQIYAASWVLKDSDPIPQDYTDDTHWP